MKIIQNPSEITSNIEPNTCVKGDCVDVLSYIKDNSVDLICADLPFGITANKWDIIIPMDKLWKHYERIIKPKGNIILFGTGLFAFKLALSNEKLFRYDMVWKKSKSGSPLTAKYMPLKKHELLLVFSKPASYYDPQMLKGKPYSRKWTENKKNNMKYGIKGVVTNNNGTRHPSTILDYKQKWRKQDQQHPTQKPVKLLEWLVKSYSPENGVVVDNTMGRGTTGMACMNTNRKFIGIELEEDMFNIACNNIQESLNKNKLFNF